MAKKKEEAKKTEEEKKDVKYEESVWTVKINSQILYKKPVEGRTVLLGMTREEMDEVEEVLDEAIEELTKVLKDRTTMHKAPEEKEQITRVDAAPPESTAEESGSEDDEEEKSDNSAKTSEKKSAKDEGDKKGEEDNGEGSLLGKLSS